MVDHSAKAALEPNTCVKASIHRLLLLPEGDGSFHIRYGSQDIDPGVPRSDVRPVGVKELEQFLAVRKADQPQLGLVFDFAKEHIPGFVKRRAAAALFGKQLNAGAAGRSIRQSN